jgi:hypothetical protein
MWPHPQPCFWLLAAMNKVPVNISHSSLYGHVLISLGQIPQSGKLQCGVLLNVYSFVRNCLFCIPTSNMRISSLPIFGIINQIINSSILMYFGAGQSWGWAQVLASARQALYHWVTSPAFFFFLTQAFPVQLMLTLNLQSSYFCLPSTGITVVKSHTWLCNPGFNL